MKPLHIALLVAAGAAGGAVIMKVTQRPPAPITAQVEAPPQTPPATAPPAVTPPVEPPAASASGEPARVAHPSPFEASKKEVREVPKPGRVHRTAPQGAPVQPPLVAQDRPVEPAPSLVVVAPQAAEPAPAPQPVPPARTEPENVTPPPPAPLEPHRVTLNAGTLIPVRLVDGLSSERNLPGDTFTATLDKELVVDGFVIAERGARVEGRVVASDRGGRVRGVASLQVEIVRLRLSDGQTIGLQTETFERRADPTHNQDAAKVGGGAALGAIIGALAGGGKGAAIGAGVGGAAGTGDVLATRGKPATLPSEMRLTFRLRAGVTVTEKGRA